MTPPTPNSTATTEAHTGIDTGTGTTSTLAEQLRQDARIRQAQELVLQALADYQSRITGIQSPAADRKDGYQSRLAEAAQLRGRPLYFPYLGSGLGNGALVELADGSVKYDMISGIGVHILGHSHPDIVKASMEAALSDVIMQGHLQQNEEPLEISRTLVEAANRNGAHLQHCFLTTSGAMANENALKILFHHQPGADRLLALSKNFAGRSLALSQITDRPDYRVGLPTAVPVDYVPFRDAHRPEQSTEQALQVLRRHLDRYPGRYAGMVFELVQGEGGVYPGDTRYFRSLMQCLREHKVPVLIDEIQTFGRTPELFAFQYYQLDDLADVVTIGKLSQVCATLFRAELNPQGPLLSQTFIAGTSALCAARTILKELMNGDYFGTGGRIEQLGTYFLRHLEQMGKRHPGLISDLYGLGGMIGFTPLDGTPALANRFVHALYQAGVIAFVAGQSPARVRFLLPYGALKPEDIDIVMDRLETTLLIVQNESCTSASNESPSRG